MSRTAYRDNRSAGLVVAMIGVGLGLAYLTYLVFSPIMASGPAKEPPKVELPAYDVAPWRGLLVQHQGRAKPFESAATEVVRQITGRAKFQRQDPTAIVLMWVLLNGNNAGTDFMDWEHYPFILCEYQTLREAIYVDHLFNKLDKKRDGYLRKSACTGPVADNFDQLDRDNDGKLTREEMQQGRHLLVGGLTDEQRHGKYISPADLRESLTVQGVVRRMEDPEGGDVEEVDEYLRDKAGTVAQRLLLYDQVSQNQWSTFRSQRPGQSGDPIQMVALDKVEGGPLFAIGDLQKCLADYNAKTGDSPAWRYILVERVRATPQLYIKPDQRAVLKEFQEDIKAKKASRAINELEKELAARREKKDRQLDELRKSQNREGLITALQTIPQSSEESQRIRNLAHQRPDRAEGEASRDQFVDKLIAELKAILAERDQKVVDDLRRRAKHAEQGKYHPEDPQFRMLHLGYLENRFPTVYRDSLAWQEFPVKDAKSVLASFDNLKKAYRTDKPEAFAKASNAFFATLQGVGQKYDSYPKTVSRNFVWLFDVDFPIEDMLGYEMTLNEVQPFQKAWIIMLLSAVLFIASMMVPSGKPARVCYVLAFVAYLAALGYQIFGFALRVIIAGRPPVSNLYETVVWVAFMSAVFALVLELIYRKKVIGLAGAVVAALGLIMADQLSLTLDPKISPLLPVLRTNYWLTIHVLTIVSSYAAGTLAWGLGNISLGIIAFGKGRKETVKTLAQYTYRAIQIAVLLLAFGTFLGGMWAAESWGRFWGWDPKEVWALIALVCYVIPLHMRYIGWVKDFGLAVAAVVCYAAIVMSWYLFNALGGGGLHAYALSGGGPLWVIWAGLLNIEWVLAASLLYVRRSQGPPAAMEEAPKDEAEAVGV